MTLHNGIRIKECAGLKHLSKLDFLDIQLLDRAMEQKTFMTIHLVMPTASTNKKS